MTSIAPEDPGEVQKNQTLRDAIEAVLLGLPDELVSRVRELLDRAPSTEIMVDAISQQFVQDPSVRQNLLEEEDVSQRISQLVDYLRTMRFGGN